MASGVKDGLDGRFGVIELLWESESNAVLHKWRYHLAEKDQQEVYRDESELNLVNIK